MPPIFCRFFDHRINRSRVWFDSLHHRTNCERCGQAMIRDVTGWRAFEDDRDADPRRDAHPNAQP
jgi:transcriptional regulator of met regulon